jgi:deoxyribodipyrimidine photo-lyase
LSGATLVWFQQDLRLADNPALDAAAKRKQPIIPVYIWSPEEEGEWRPGAASRWWLHHSLASLDASLRERRSRLVLAHGDTGTALRKLVRQTGADAVFWNHRYEPAAVAREHKLETTLQGARSFNGSLLAEPWEMLNQSGKPYQVYTPFKRRLQHEIRPSPALKVKSHLPAPARWPKSVSLNSLRLMPPIKWYRTIEKTWEPGEAGAQARLKTFLRRRISDYATARDRPAIAGTSMLSPHLHFGEISPRRIWHALGAKGRATPFLAEIIWREFAYHLLYHFPQTPLQPLRQEFAAFPWKKNARALRAWQRGLTGQPLVDAGMRELWATGFMHNRVRMIVASFLVKNLLIPWQEGARWFWDTLVDADLANNTLNWQWVSGCGADAAPYFRIFNPESQARRFDPQAAYIRQWAPVTRTYPKLIVDLRASREAALDAYKAMRARKRA